MSGHLKNYRGTPQQVGRFVVTIIKNGKLIGTLDDKRDLVNFASGGFSWGMDENGGNQLCLALLADALDDALAVKLCQAFRSSHFDFMPPYESWRLCENSIAAIAHSCETKLSENGR